jgi:hypothetical protein
MLVRVLLAVVACSAATMIGGVAHAAPPDPAYAETLVARAHGLGLAERAAWLRLGHYRKGHFGGLESEADGEPFFLAPDGKTQPEHELDATLRGFFSAVPKKPGVEHPLCRFPARWLWLSRELGIDRRKLPLTSCPRYDEFMALMRPVSYTLVFSSYFLNNPASAFGHTFLRVNRAKPRGSGAQPSNELLDYGIDFSAVVDTSNAFLYGFKGMTGLFPGTFNKVPLYYKIREYNDYESRDLWEYDLALTPSEVELVSAHLWELGSTYFAYYYLSENCSYQILAALEVANPKLELMRNVGWPVIPADTVKALLKNPGLVRGIRYRPSNRTAFRARLESLSGAEQSATLELAQHPRAELPPSFSQGEQVRVIDAAIDLASVRGARDIAKERSEMDAEALEREQALLERRAHYGIPSESHEFAPPFRQMPHLGHGSTRLALGSGYDREAGYFHLASFRLALHDLADPARGYPDGAEIEFLPVSLRYTVERPRITLQDVSLVRVLSLTPLTRFEHTFSWLVDVGARRLHDPHCSECLAGFGELGGGFTLEPFGRGLTLFALANAEVDVPARGGYFDWLRVAVGPYGGLRLRPSDGIAALLTGSWSYLPLERANHAWGLEGKLRVAYARNAALGVEGRLYETTATAQAVSYLYF